MNSGWSQDVTSGLLIPEPTILATGWPPQGTTARGNVQLRGRPVSRQARAGPFLMSPDKFHLADLRLQLQGRGRSLGKPIPLPLAPWRSLFRSRPFPLSSKLRVYPNTSPPG